MSDLKLGKMTDSSTGVWGFGQKSKDVTVNPNEMSDQLGISMAADKLGIKTGRTADDRVTFASEADALAVIKSKDVLIGGGKRDFAIFKNPDGTYSIAKLEQDVKPGEISTFKQESQKGSAPTLVGLFTDEDQATHGVAAPPPPPPANPNAGNSILERFVGASKDLQ